MTSPNTETLQKAGNLAEGVEILSGEHAEFYVKEGYTGICKINGKVVGVMEFIFTWGICVGLDNCGYEYRFCYGSFADAAVGLSSWLREGGDEPKNYIKRK